MHSMILRDSYLFLFAILRGQRFGERSAVCAARFVVWPGVPRGLCLCLCFFQQKITWPIRSIVCVCAWLCMSYYGCYSPVSSQWVLHILVIHVSGKFSLGVPVLLRLFMKLIQTGFHPMTIAN